MALVWLEQVLQLVQYSDHALAHRILLHLLRQATGQPSITAQQQDLLTASRTPLDALRALGMASVTHPALTIRVSPLELSAAFRVSLTLAKQQLLVAEGLEYLCRDQSPHGVYFSANFFALC